MEKTKKNLLSWLLMMVIIVSMLPAMKLQPAAKTTPNGETVNTVLFYAVDRSGNRVLVSQIPITEYLNDHQDLPVHNYSVLDRYVTTVHQEATGLTVPEFVGYAAAKSTDSDLSGENLHFTGSDQIAFWEIDQTGYDDMDTYTYEDLYGVERFNFPEIYRYWDYTRQDYADPAGVMSREEVIGHLLNTGVQEQMLLSVTAFSQRFMITEAKYGEADYNMENYWDSQDLLDTERTIRLMIPMTEKNLREKQSTASNTRYWVSQILLDMSETPSFSSKGTVAVPTAVMTEDDENYYVRFNCETPGATVYFNHNYQSLSYMPTCPYDGDAVEIPKSKFKSGSVTLTAHAVKDGYDDAGVVTLTLTSSGVEIPVQKPTVQCGEGGSYTLSEDGTELTVVPDQGYEVREVTLNGSSKGAVSSLSDLKTGDQVLIIFEKNGSTDPSDQDPPDPPVRQTGYSDVADDAWYAPAVQYVAEKGYFNGTSETEFSPEMSMTRAMFVTVLGRRAGVDPSLHQGSDFTDVPEGQWYSAYVQWASQNGIVTGFGKGVFDPEREVTREQMAVILYRYADFCGLSKTVDEKKFYGYVDRDQVSDFAKDAMIWATDRGILNGMGDGTLMPQGTATRAQVAQIIINYSQKAI